MASRLTSNNTSRLPVPNLKAPVSKMGAVGGTKGPSRRVLGDITKQNLQNVNNSKLVAKPVLAKPTLNNTALARPRLTRQAVRRLSVPPKVEDTVSVDYTEQAKSLAPPPGVLDAPTGALDPEDQLLGGLGLPPQDGLGLTAEALLLAIVPPSALSLLTLGRLLVLGDLELAVLVAPGAVGVPCLGDVHHFRLL